ncbi:MAG: hypothetical protein LBC22_05255 [Endomicrobium sp.]|jgi:hypothetical protein|nr:hypothetical protein [Endomicrobium sp.]
MKVTNSTMKTADKVAKENDAKSFTIAGINCKEIIKCSTLLSTTKQIDVIIKDKLATIMRNRLSKRIFFIIMPK